MTNFLFYNVYLEKEAEITQQKTIWDKISIQLQKFKV